MNKTTFLQKSTACLVAGLVLVAAFLVLGRSLPPNWVIPEVIFGLAGLSLLTALIYPFIWQRKENRQTVDSLVIMNFWHGVIRYGLAFDIAIFGFKKIFGQQFIVRYAMYDERLGSLSGEWLTWHYFGFSYPFGLIVASAQIGGSILLLFPRTRLVGVVLLLPVLLNILLINVFYGLNAGATAQSFLLCVGLFYLLFLDYSRLVDFFFTSKEKLQNIVVGNTLVKNGLRVLMIFIPFLLTFSTYYKELMPSNIRGTYEVERASDVLNKEGVLTKIYFDRYDDCIFLYNENSKKFNKYQFNNNKNQVSIVFYKENQQNDTLSATVMQLENNQKLKISGVIGQDSVEMELLKVR